MPSRPRLAHRRVRVYETLRTAHLERAHEFAPASVVYRKQSYDFDTALLDGLDVHHCPGASDLARLLARSDVRELEVNEPLMLSALRHGLTAALAVRVAGAVRRRRVTVVTYALANTDPFAGASRHLRSRPRRTAFRGAVRLMMRLVDRIAFGSPAAEEEYDALLRRAGRTEHRLVPALPRPCETCGPLLLDAPAQPMVLFLGAFDHRKGVAQLLDAWPEIHDRHPALTLRLLGKGPLQDLAETAAARPEVTLVVDPERDEVHRSLREARVLVLLSQPSRTWREQIGLPLVEAIAHDCEVVTTTETGLASWLSDAGHQVLAPEATSHQVADAVLAAAAASRTPGTVLGSLPTVDGRRAADEWLFAPAADRS